jgi:predicted TPR repeat methyltransferase
VNAHAAMTGRASLAYRKHEAAILSGQVPEKYTRILPHIPPGQVLEIGSAEGVLACLLARSRRCVTALEKNPERHEAAKRLYEAWRERGIPFAGLMGFVPGNITDHLDLLDRADVLVAVRMIYYLGDDLDTVFAAAAHKVPSIVLCGNRNRADAWRRGQPHEPLGEMNRYASREGMRELLERHGYTITDEVTEGDEIVVGLREENWRV